MANKYFNKQVAESRKPLFAGGMVKRALKKLGNAFKSRGKKLSDNEKLLIKAKNRRLDKGIKNGK